jgi:selenocysteine lyase/cysteine desulfurase
VAGYLDTASYGLPPASAWTELQQALADWQTGRTRWETWMGSVERSRVAIAELLGVAPETIALGSTTSELVALLAAAVPDGSRILTATGDFTSLTFPWAVHSGRGIETVEAPLSELPSRIDAGTTVVAVSLVQSASGEVLDVDALLAAAEAHGALTVIDATQATGWLPIDASRFDAVVGAAYKWLMSPRGTAYLSLKEGRWPGLLPLHAGWCAGPDPLSTFYGLPLRLADTARRFDTSPAWFSWVGAAPALELLARIGVAAVGEHDVALANRFRGGLGLEPGDSAIVSVARSVQETNEARVSSRSGRLRASFHLYNDEDDVDALLSAVECA